MSALNPDTDNSVVEQALHDGDLLKALLDHLEAGIYVVDRRRRILYWNGGAEHISGFLSQNVTGHYCQGDLLLHCDASGGEMCGTGCPLSPVLTDGKPREHDLFLLHRQGHRIPVHVRSRAIFDAAGAIIGALEVFESRILPAPIARRTLADTSCVDPVAEANNRAYGEFRLGQALEARRAFGIPFGWLVVKLDGIEKLERRYGQLLLDAAMKMTARTLDWNLGPQDFATRWDRTEFRIEVHSCWGVELSALIGKLAALVRTSKLDWWGDPVRVTASIGGTTAELSDSLESIEDRAAGILQKSRTAGSDPEKDFLGLGDERCLE